MLLAGLVLLWMGTIALLAFVYREALANAWAEPVLREPVLILESDDWGYGPLEQARALAQIADLLARFRDSIGAQPAMTLGVILGGPDTVRIRADDCRAYHRLTLADRALAPVQAAMREGERRAVFALQLHGMEHFWPACLMRAALSDESVRDWLTGAPFPATEALPSALQSRWIDATELPSKPLPTEAAIAAAAEEMRTFAGIFGAAPQVAVPPTFVWTREVEAAWARAGVGVVVTPGRHSDKRDRDGRIVVGKRLLFNGAKGTHGVVYLVRDCYLEPSRGQTHHRTAEDLRAKTRLGRPTLVEIHRANFIGDVRGAEHALAELRLLLETAQTNFPSLRFMSSAELARHYRERSPLVERRTRARVHVLIRRLGAISRLRKLAWATGAALPVCLAYAVTLPWGWRKAEPVA